MKQIFCELNLFDVNQKIYIIDTDTKEVNCLTTTSIKELPDVINFASQEKKINKIILSGISANEMSQRVFECNAKNYSKNKIEIEVI